MACSVLLSDCVFLGNSVTENYRAAKIIPEKTVSDFYYHRAVTRDPDSEEIDVLKKSFMDMTVDIRRDDDIIYLWRLGRYIDLRTERDHEFSRRLELIRILANGKSPMQGT